MKRIFILFIFLVSCREEEIQYRDIEFVVIEKISLQNSSGGIDYFLKSKDTIIKVDTQKYAKYKVNDTICFTTPIDGFFRGTIFIK